MIGDPHFHMRTAKHGKNAQKTRSLLDKGRKGCKLVGVTKNGTEGLVSRPLVGGAVFFAPIFGSLLFGNQAAQYDAIDENQASGPFGPGCPLKRKSSRRSRRGVFKLFAMESLILAQNERWRHGLGMQVERQGSDAREWRKGE